MLNNNSILFQEFKKNAESVSAFVSEIKTFDEIYSYIKKLSNQFKTSTENTIISLPSQPWFSQQNQKKLKIYLNNSKITLKNQNSDKYLGKVDIGVTFANYGISETGTLILDLKDYNCRLTTMICDIHLCILKKSAIKKSADELIDIFMTFSEKESSYLSFITGASRTADIERVLVLGVHGPLELHILVQEDMVL